MIKITLIYNLLKNLIFFIVLPNTLHTDYWLHTDKNNIMCTINTINTIFFSRLVFFIINKISHENPPSIFCRGRQAKNINQSNARTFHHLYSFVIVFFYIWNFLKIYFSFRFSDNNINHGENHEKSKSSHCLSWSLCWPQSCDY
jgi:hypothetical protein